MKHYEKFGIFCINCGKRSIGSTKSKNIFKKKHRIKCYHYSLAQANKLFDRFDIK